LFGVSWKLQNTLNDRGHYLCGTKLEIIVMMNIIKLFKYFIKKTTYNWNIDPADRSWIISQDGEIKGGINHRIILKIYFTKEWDELKHTNKDDSEIEMLLENRFLNAGMVYIGELTNLYAITLKLDKREKDIIQCFVKSFLLKHNDFRDRNITIQIYKGKTEKYKICQIVNSYLIIYSCFF